MRELISYCDLHSKMREAAFTQLGTDRMGPNPDYMDYRDRTDGMISPPLNNRLMNGVFLRCV
jgi:hypothetical protein